MKEHDGGRRTTRRSRRPSAEGKTRHGETEVQGATAAAATQPTTKFTVFLDRDGVFNRNPKFAVVRKKGFVWLPGALAAFARLNRPDIQTCLATNQPFLGTFTLGLRVRPVNEGLRAALEAAGGRLDRMEASFAPPWIDFLGRRAPGRLRQAFRRRKPGPGMLEDGGAALNVDRSRAVMVGDKVKDAEAAAAYGIPAILLATTHSQAKLWPLIEKRHVKVHAVVAGLPEAVDLILQMADTKR